jgi:hypothetical protein
MFSWLQVKITLLVNGGAFGVRTGLRELGSNSLPVWIGEPPS